MKKGIDVYSGISNGVSKNYIPKLKKLEALVVDEMAKKYKYSNKLQAPKLEKIVVSTSHNAAKEDTKFLDEAIEQIARITGQRPVRTHVRMAISNFKIKENQPIGCKVTLRRECMWEFLDRFVNIAVPRMRDFRGFGNKSFDKSGNYNLGIADITIFPEAQVSKISRAIGVGITFCVKTSTIDEALTYLGMLGVPFRK
ncbi:MAG: 50S ribosomal protein L5 [Elusimicrobia bacterium CG08_land_8_20_14_0_20_44_26]|nr:MAG: 50S ribosomal protein L5 [Elusimicrobia bacterium CG08_land_8_20_14_0_20_44_26]